MNESTGQNQPSHKGEELVLNLLKSGRALDAYILARFCYRMNEPIINDRTYEMLQDYCKKFNLDNKGYLTRTYDDDPVPSSLLWEFGMGHLENQYQASRKMAMDTFTEDASLSIEAVKNYDTAYGRFMALKSLNEDIIFSLKGNGVNTQTKVQHGKIHISRSRSRSGEGFDYTDGMKRVLKDQCKVFSEYQELILFSEAFVFEENLEYLRNKYNESKYTFERSAAFSMLVVEHDLSDYNLVNVMVFDIDGLADSYSETFSIAQSLGFMVAPNFTVKPQDVPATRTEFDPWLREQLDKMYHMSSGIPSDGVVVSVDSKLVLGDVKGQYKDTNFALKMEYWGFDSYLGKVVAITQEQRAMYANCKLVIEPMKTNDKANATVINAFNPAIIFEENIRIGTEVKFERNSGAVNILLHGKKIEGTVSEVLTNDS